MHIFSWNITPHSNFPLLQNRCWGYFSCEQHFSGVTPWIWCWRLSSICTFCSHWSNRAGETQSRRAGQQDSCSTGAHGTQVCQAVSKSLTALHTLPLLSQGIWTVPMAGSHPQNNFLCPSLRKSCPGGQSGRELTEVQWFKSVLADLNLN